MLVDLVALHELTGMPWPMLLEQTRAERSALVAAANEWAEIKDGKANG